LDILGINHSIDAAAALLRDGEILAAVSDERFTHEKHSRGFPLDSVRYCLRHGGVDLAGLECVAFFWNPGLQLQSLNARRAGAPRHHSEYLWSLPNQLLAQYPRHWDELEVEHVEQRFVLKGAAQPLRIFYVSHHMAHAASAFFVSPFEEAAILTVDGYGERASAMLGQGRDRRVSSLREIRFPHSLGSFYAAITQYLGFRPNCEEGSVMGLAAHGEPRWRAQLAELVRLAADGGFELDLSFFDYYREAPRRYAAKFIERFGPERAPDEPLEDRHRDMAASAQAVLEDAMVHLARHLKRVTGARRLCLAGGVALNCVANSRVLEDGGFEDAFIQPAAGDNGSSLGAALYVCHQLLDHPRGRAMETDFRAGRDPRLVPGAHGVRAARARSPQHPGRPAPR
jgi:carbamoyltransferase